MGFSCSDLRVCILPFLAVDQIPYHPYAPSASGSSFQALAVLARSVVYFRQIWESMGESRETSLQWAQSSSPASPPPAAGGSSVGIPAPAQARRRHGGCNGPARGPSPAARPTRSCALPPASGIRVAPGRCAASGQTRRPMESSESERRGSRPALRCIADPGPSVRSHGGRPDGGGHLIGVNGALLES